MGLCIRAMLGNLPILALVGQSIAGSIIGSGGTLWGIVQAFLGRRPMEMGTISAHKASAAQPPLPHPLPLPLRNPLWLPLPLCSRHLQPNLLRRVAKRKTNQPWAENAVLGHPVQPDWQSPWRGRMTAGTGERGTMGRKIRAEMFYNRLQPFCGFQEANGCRAK